MLYLKIKRIPSFLDYGVDRDGNVYSYKGWKGRPVPYKLSFGYTIDGYRTVTLSSGTVPYKSITKRVHRLVLETFIGLCPKGMQACHNNGIKTDNRVENLRWDTCKNNCADRKRHGKTQGCIGEDHPKAKLTDKKVKEIRNLEGKLTHKEIAKQYSMSRCQVSKIIAGQFWTHVT